MGEAGESGKRDDRDDQAAERFTENLEEMCRENARDRVRDFRISLLLYGVSFLAFVLLLMLNWRVTEVRMQQVIQESVRYPWLDDKKSVQAEIDSNSERITALEAQLESQE